MTNTILSIIVPIYKAEPYLRDCLKSILCQTFTHFELILVDDGSPDTCGEICDEYTLQDERIIVIHQKNSGVSSARNAGLDIAKGEYITFVDPDDELGDIKTYEENFQILLNNKKIDILQYPTYRKYGTPGAYMHLNKPECIMGKKSLFLNWCLGNGKISHGVCNKIFKQSIFRSLRFPIGKVFEDAYCIIDFIDASNCLYLSDKGCYRYYVRNESITHSDFSLKKKKDYLDFQLKLYERASIYKKFEMERIQILLNILRVLLHAIAEYKEENFSVYNNMIKTNFPTTTSLIKSGSGIGFLTTIKLMYISIVGFNSYQKIWMTALHIRCNTKF